MTKQTEQRTVINISFTQNEQHLLSVLDDLVKYDLASNRSAWFKDQIRNRYYEMRVAKEKQQELENVAAEVWK